jgi:glycosyltransferase involved in cell wall biosynthesis
LSEGFYGSERYCCELAATQARQGHTVTIVTLGANSDATRAARRSLSEATGPKAGAVQVVAIPRALPAFLQRPLMRAIIRRFRPDVVHTHLDPATRRLGEVARRLGIPHVATLHLNFTAREYGGCDGLICIAQWQQKMLPADFAGASTVVQNWLPVAVTQDLARLSADAVAGLRRTWDADENAFVFGSVGRLVPEKGMDLLIGAFRTAFPSGTEPMRLVIVGDGPQRGALDTLAAGDPRIVLAGAQTDVAVFYRAFDTYVSAARFEPFGLSILEAMAAGCPLVLTRSQGPVEFVSDARVRWVNDTTQAALADALRRTPPGERVRLTYGIDAFTPARATAEIERFYANVIARTAERRARHLR